MVSGSKVRGDLGTIKECFSEYSAKVGSIDSTWMGASANEFKTTTNEFNTSFLSTMTSGMDSFATACDKYEEYKTAKSNLATAQSNKAAAEARNDSSAASQYQSDINNLTTKISTLKTDITTLLNSVSSKKLEAKALPSITASTNTDGAGKDGETGTTTGSGKLAGKNWAGKDFVYYNMSGGWKNYRYSNSRRSNTMGKSGCGPCSMAMVLASYGFKVNPNNAADWSADHGYHGDGTSEAFFPAYAKKFGVKSKNLGRSETEIRKALESGQLVIFHVGKGRCGFTDHGHYNVGRVYKNGKVLIGDPNKGRGKNGKWFKLSDIVHDLRGNAWTFYM